MPIAGGTDLYVQREDLPRRPVRVLGAGGGKGGPWRGIERTGESLRLGALTTFQDLAESVELRGLLPRLPEVMDEIASWQIRNRATIGGNLVNASPIGDLTAILYDRRAVPLEHRYFVDGKAHLIVDAEGRQRASFRGIGGELARKVPSSGMVT